jgi:DNA-binding transcriptional LysR family regulator
VARDGQELRGRYVLGCHPSVALYTLPRLLPGVLRSHPALELKLAHDLSRRIAEDVISFKIDFGIVVNPPPHPDLVIRKLFTDEVSFWIAAAAKPAELDTLICDPELVQTQKLLRQLGRAGLHFRRTVTSSNLEVIQALVAAGAGVGILPARVATRVKTPAIRPLGKNLPGFHDEICLVYRADLQNSAASRSLAAEIARALV